jgi:Putative zinc-finger
MTRDEDVDRLIREGARGQAPAGPCVEAERLAAFYQDALSEADADAVRAHLATCPTCVEATRDLRRFLDAMRAEPAGGSRVRRPAHRFALAAVLAGIGLLGGMLYLAWRSAGPAPGGPDMTIVVAPPPYEAGADELVWRGEGSSPLERGAALYRAGDYPEAAGEFAAYVAAHPDDARGRFYLGVARLLSGKPSLAAADLETARALPGAPADTTWYLALAYLKSDDRPRARVELLRVAGSQGPHGDEARALLRRIEPGDAR